MGTYMPSTARHPAIDILAFSPSSSHDAVQEVTQHTAALTYNDVSESRRASNLLHTIMEIACSKFDTCPAMPVT